MTRLWIPRRRFGRRPRQRGFVLLMSLVLLVIAAVIMAGIARYSLSIALEASEARQSLQDRWARASLSRAVLSRADKILAQHVAAAARGNVELSSRYPAAYTVRLGNLDYELVLDEENRKLNLNGLSSAGGREQVLKTLHLLRQSSSTLWLRSQLAVSQETSVQRLGSWGQVFRLEELPDTEPEAAWLMANTRQLTCWGNGRLHYRKANDMVLQAGAEAAVGPVTAVRLVNLRRQSPSLKLNELLDGMGLRQSEKLRLRDRLTEESTCYSLWLTRQGGERMSSALMIAEKTGDGSFRIQRFTW